MTMENALKYIVQMRNRAILGRYRILQIKRQRFFDLDGKHGNNRWIVSCDE